MYCVKCGVELADSEKKCPLCGTEVICPGEEKREISPPPYPPYPGAVREGVSRNGVLFVLTVLFLLPFCLCLICDIKINGRRCVVGLCLRRNTAHICYVGASGVVPPPESGHIRAD